MKSSVIKMNIQTSFTHNDPVSSEYICPVVKWVGPTVVLILVF